MITPVKGKDAFLWVERSSVYVLTVCSKSLNLDFDIEDIATSTKDSGTDNYYKAGYSDATVSMEALSPIDQLSRYQFYDFIENRRLIHQLKIVFTNSYGDILQYVFKAKVQKVSLAADVKAFLGNSITLKVCGPLTKTILYKQVLLDGLDNLILDENGDLIRV